MPVIEPMREAKTSPWIRRLFTWGFLALGAGIAAFVPLYHGLNRFYLANSDQDIDLTYQALLLNDGYGIPYHPHTGYGYSILLAPWLTFAEKLGFIEASGIDALIGSTRFDDLYTQIIAAGRLLSVVYAMAAVLVFWWIARLCCGSRVIASVAAFILGSSLGLGYQSSVLRTELPSMLAILVAFAMVLTAVRLGGWRGTIALGFSAFAAMFGFMTKVQAVIVSAFLPFVPFLFANPPITPTPSLRMIGGFALACAMIGSIGLFRLVSALMMGATWAYQAIGLAVLVGAVVLYSRARLGDLRWTIPALSAMGAGAGAAASLVYVSDHWWTLFGIANAIEFLAPNHHHDARVEDTIAMVSSMLSLGVGEMSKLWLEFHGGPRDYPLQIMLWLSLAGTVLLLWLGRWQEAIRILFFLAFPLALIFVFTLRGYAYYYQIYTEPFFILAGAILAAALAEQGGRRKGKTVIVAYALLALFIGASTVRYRLIAPSTGTTRDARHACCSMDYAVLIADHFKPYCAQATEACPLNWTQLRAVGDSFLKK